MPNQTAWLSWARELQALAQNGLAYTENAYDRERFERIRQIAAEMVAGGCGLPLEQVTGLFCNETGYQTPKLDTRAAIVEEGRILLVQERDGRWALPGGWVDADLTIAQNAAKETLEEAGLQVTPWRLVAMHDRSRRNPGLSPWGIQKAFVLCRRLGGQFQPNQETIASGWFSLDDLPVLALSKTTPEQIALCMQAADAACWETVFD